MNYWIKDFPNNNDKKLKILFLFVCFELEMNFSYFKINAKLTNPMIPVIPTSLRVDFVLLLQQ